MDEYIKKQDVINSFQRRDYPITYQDGSIGIGMGYCDFIKMLVLLPKYRADGLSMADDAASRHAAQEEPKDVEIAHVGYSDAECGREK